jgi:quercetin dioxygenase-like cupin family protein
MKVDRQEQAGTAMEKIDGKKALVLAQGEGKRLNVMGSDTYVKLTAADTNGQLSMFVVDANPGDGVPMHTHTREDEIFYVLSGQVRFATDQGEQIAQAGATVFLPRGGPHAWWTHGTTPAKLIIMTLPGTFDAFFAEIALPPGKAPHMPTVIETCLRYGITFAPPPPAPAI